MTLGNAVDLFSQPLFSSMQLVMAMALYCWRQPRRERFGLRATLVVGGYLAATVMATYLGFVVEPRLMGEWSFPTQMLLFGSLTFLWVALVLFCYEVSVRTAVFLMIAGFSTYHTATGVIGTAVILAGGAGLFTMAEPIEVAVIPTRPNLFVVVVGILSTAVVYTACYHLFAKSVKGEWVARSNDRTIAAIFVGVILIDVIYDLSMMSTFGYHLPTFQYAVFGLTKTFICFFLLYVEFQILLVDRLRSDMELSERLFAERERQYQLSRESIDAINIKCHDIRHQIRLLRDGAGGTAPDADALDDIAREVGIYDAAVKTGNDALDTILTEKSLLCERDSITLTCIVDGPSLDFMRPVELYSLFGNILDNAIEAVTPISEPGKRSVSLVVQRRGDMVSIHEENYYVGSLEFEGDVPKTTKGDPTSHGFGTRSILKIVERHDGSVNFCADGGLFRFDALIPLP